MLALSLADQVLGVAADFAHSTLPPKFERVSSINLELDHGGTNIVQSEAAIEQPHERTDGAGRIVVLGLAEQQRAASFEVAQVHVIAQRRAAYFAAAIHHQHDLGFGVVPRRIRAHADLRSPADARQWRGLRENLGVRADRHFEILRPQIFFDQRLLESRRSLTSRNDRPDAPADSLLKLVAKRSSQPVIPPRALLDHSFDRRDGESDARRFDGLQVHGREEPLSRQFGELFDPE